MTDLYALLTRAIESQPDNSAETRHAVYNHIRGLYDRQRQEIDSTLSQEEIQAERARLVREQASLETVIARIEAERSGVPVASEDVLAFDRYATSKEPQEDTARIEFVAVAGGDTGRERPRIAARRELRERPSLRRSGAFVVIALVLAGIGGAAWWLRNDDTPAQTQADAGATVTAGSDKIVDRVNGVPPDDLTSQAQVPQSAQQPAPAIPAAAGQSDHLAQRAFLFEMSANNNQPKITAGQVVWRLEGQGNRNAVLQADVSLEEAGLKFTLVMRPNEDTALPASHTMEITFINDANSPDRAVRDIAVPQLRADKEPRGVPLIGLPIPVADNIFLVGLSNLPADVSRNYSLLRERDWMDVPVRFANGETGTITFAKGSVGQQIITDALDSWQ